MIAYASRRLAQAIFALISVTLIVFLVVLHYRAPVMVGYLAYILLCPETRLVSRSRIYIPIRGFDNISQTNHYTDFLLSYCNYDCDNSSDSTVFANMRSGSIDPNLRDTI
jgi:hypothetical protein